ncbi:hypothetical protein NQ117_14785 [Paenibacillus sp. SC116]|uniref:hypothetical protein n=1 Tax=Paenibacillus sp. SC116 TaxID=2968986 RepID=UPI00215AB7C4|nr:hypothetical protein [Paenibacillus sp. SC116]MCR8844945.1 hypothetical protein [Paenibacillus sp. SC116]
MKKKHIISVVLIILMAISLFSYFTFFSEIRESKIQETYNQETKQFSADISFKINSFFDVSNVNVYVIYPDGNVEREAGILVGEKIFNVVFKKQLSEAEKEKFYIKRPEYLVTWVEKDKKKVSYIYSSTTASPFLR